MLKLLVLDPKILIKDPEHILVDPWSILISFPLLSPGKSKFMSQIIRIAHKIWNHLFVIYILSFHYLISFWAIWLYHIWNSSEALLDLVHAWCTKMTKNLTVTEYVRSNFSYSCLVGNIVDMLTTCWQQTKMSYDSHNIVICFNVNFFRFLLSRAYQTMTQVKLEFFILYCIFDFFVTRGVKHRKKEKTCLEVHFLCPKVLRFLSFSWHVWSCCSLVSVSIDFEMSQHLTTKYSCICAVHKKSGISTITRNYLLHHWNVQSRGYEN